MCNNDYPYSKNQHGKQIDRGFLKGPIMAHTQILEQRYRCFCNTEELKTRCLVPSVAQVI